MMTAYIGSNPSGALPEGDGPMAAFIMSDNPVDADNTVAFSDTSAGLPTSWDWQCNGVSFSSDQNPTKYFSTPGSYVITLTVTSGYGTDSTSQTLTVTSRGGGDGEILP